MAGCYHDAMRASVVLTIAIGLAPALVAAQPRARPPTVAILYFDYTGKTVELEQLRKGFARMLISDLATTNAFTLVERERLEEVLAELKLGQSTRIDAKSAARIGKLLGARYQVMGGYFDLGGVLRVDARVVEVETSKVLKSMGAHRRGDEFLLLEQKLAADLGAALLSVTTSGGAAPRGVTKPKASSAPPKTLDVKVAARYGRALDAKDRGDVKKARKELGEVLKEQPDFTLALKDLAALAK
jgi:TolB-like protein